jgi:hypothetical protein
MDQLDARGWLGATVSKSGGLSMAQVRTAAAGGRRAARWPAVAALVLIAAMPVVTWWLVGDQTSPEMRERMQAATPDPGIASGLDPDYDVRPPRLAATTERTIGVVAVVLVVSSVGALVVATRTGRLDRRWWPVLAALSLVGAGCALWYRTATAAVDGGNIGAGILLLFGGPLALVLLGWALWRGLSLIREAG